MRRNYLKEYKTQTLLRVWCKGDIYKELIAINITIRTNWFRVSDRDCWLCRGALSQNILQENK